MKICMLGTGSLGSTIGGTLAQGGSEVYFVDQWKEHIDKINENGLKMTDEKEDWYVKVDARTTAEGIGPCHCFSKIICNKRSSFPVKRDKCDR